MRILISAAASPAAVSIIKHLKNSGHEVYGMDGSKNASFLGKNFCDKFFISPLAIDKKYIDYLCKLLREVDLFLPFIDEELKIVADNWDFIPYYLRLKIAISPPQTVITCLDKIAFQVFCENKGLPIAKVSKDIPAVYKPRYGRGGRGVLFLDDYAIFNAVKSRDGVIQEKIYGREFTIDAIFNQEGKLIMSSSRERLLSSSVSIIGKVSYDQKLHDLAKKIGEFFEFKYAINFQVIRDRNNKDWLIELNPRLAGSVIFSVMAGFDPLLATVNLYGGKDYICSSPKNLTVWRYWSEIND